MSINRVVITGRLGKDLDLRYTKAGKAVIELSVAVTDGYDREKTHWISVTVWGKTAENCAEYLAKGSSVGVDGRLNTRNYENKNGQKVYVTEVVADRVEFLDNKNKSDGPIQKREEADWSEVGADIEMGDDSEEIPF